MRVPSTKETIAYFGSLGYLVEKVVLRDRVSAWKITGPGCPLDGREFYTRLALWAEWLDYSAERIFEAEISAPLKDKWSKTAVEMRASIIDDIRSWDDGDPPRWIKQTLRKSHWGTDNLPKDWKARIALIVVDREKRRPLNDLVNSLTQEAGPPTA